jgi:hypothetical protein
MKTLAEATIDKTFDTIEAKLRSKFVNVPFVGSILDAFFVELTKEEHAIIDQVVAELEGTPPVPMS